MLSSETVQEGQALPVVTRTVTQEQIARYAAASGDDNPIHLEAAAAAGGPFRRIVAHGMLTFATVSQMLTWAFGRDWLESGRLKARFRAPVYPGEEVSTFGMVGRITERNGVRTVHCTVGCRKGNGQDVMTGEAWVTLGGS